MATPNMATPNVLGVYELLRRAMQQQALQQRGADSGSAPNGATEYNPDDYGSPQGGLLGRLLDLQAEQRSDQPLDGNDGPAPSVPPDTNFRLTSRFPATRTQGAIDAPNRSVDQASATYSPAGGGGSLDPLTATGQGGGLFGAHGGSPLLPWGVPSPTQRSDQPLDGNDGPAPSVPGDTNFRLTSRFPVATRPQGAVDAPNRSVDAASPNYSPAAGGASLDPLTATGQSGGLFGAYGGSSLPPWGVPSPTMTSVPVGWRLRGIPIPAPIPMPSTASWPLPSTPMPAIPEWWQAAGAILQLFPRIVSGMGGGGGGDDEDCKEEIREARKMCTGAFVDGWKSDYGVGPYKKPSGKPWNIQDCMRGFISERCGGNALDK